MPFPRVSRLPLRAIPARSPALRWRPLAALALCLLVIAGGLAGVATGATGAHAAAAPASTPLAPPPITTALTVSGAQLLASGQPVTLHGVNRSGTEYACIQGWGIFDGPSDAASVAAIASWGVTLVRVPLNEDCWLGINGVNAAYAGTNYQSAIEQYVALLHSYGIRAELSLIWGAPGASQATYQSGAPDEDHSPALWASLAATFASDNEDILAPWGETIVDWDCFLNGGTCEATYGSSNTPYAVAGMQQAVTDMRGAGYTGVISIPCIDYANDCDDTAPYFGGQSNASGGSGATWLNHEPSDPLHQLVAEAHVYGNNTCGAQSGGACLNATMSQLAASVPLLFGETGETYDGSECTSNNEQTILTWADAHNVSWAAWAWDTWGDCSTLALISDYAGTVNAGAYPAYIHTHLLNYGSSRGGGGSPTPTPTPPSPTPSPTQPPAPTPSPSPSPTPPPTGGRFVAMGFAIGYQLPTTPPWGDITQEDLFALQTENGTGLDTHFLSGMNVPAWTAAAHAHGVQAMITIGGIADQNWQNACTGANQAGFISNLVNYMVSNGFDGIDLDIEDDAWAAENPPVSAWTQCVAAISAAAKAVKTQAGATPIISEDVTTPWMGTYVAPMVAAVDQFNLMTYGDTTGGSLQSDVQTTESQGLPAAKLVPGIDVIDAPSTSNQCGPFAAYAQQNGLLGAFVWDEVTDEGNGYACLSQFAPYVGTGSGSPPPPPPPPPPTPTPSPNPSPTPVPPTPTPNPTPSPTPVPPTPTPNPGGKCPAAQNVTYNSLTALPSATAVRGTKAQFVALLTTACADEYDFVEFNLYDHTGDNLKAWDVQVNFTGAEQAVAYTWAIPTRYATGAYTITATALNDNGAPLPVVNGAGPLSIPLTISKAA